MNVGIYETWMPNGTTWIDVDNNYKGIHTILLPYIYCELPIIYQRVYSYHVGFNFYHPIPTFLS